MICLPSSLYFTDSCSFSAPTFLIFSLSSSSSVLRRKHNTNNWLSQAMSSLWFLKLSLKCLDHLAWYLCNACFFFIACGWLVRIIGIKFKYLPEKNFNKGKKIERERGDDDDRVWITSVLLIMSHKETIERKGESI